MLLTRIGNGAIQKLAKEGIPKYLIEEKDPDISIGKLLNRTLAAKRTGNCSCSCSGGEHNHHHLHYSFFLQIALILSIFIT